MLTRRKKEKTLTNKTLFLFAIATSIDALAVGMSFAFIKLPIIKPIILIGIITFIMCLFGVAIGKKCMTVLKNHAEIVGGILLILIGIKILVEHLNIEPLFFFVLDCFYWVIL